jgi:hypothetical protein
MTELSPAAQTVLDAYRSTHLSINNLVAALRAAAVYCTRDRRILMTIADELEGTNGWVITTSTGGNE